MLENVINLIIVKRRVFGKSLMINNLVIPVEVRSGRCPGGLVARLAGVGLAGRCAGRLFQIEFGWKKVASNSSGRVAKR